MATIAELQLNVLKALKALQENRSNHGPSGVDEDLSSYLYTPDSRLNRYLDLLKLENEKRQEKHHESMTDSAFGKLFEQIAYLCFIGLAGYSAIKSFQSPGPQYDLIITGDTETWLALCEIIYITTRRDFLVEVKATNEKVNDQQFARLCSLLTLNLCTTSGLGIFFTINGATGFPGPGSTRQRSLSDARLRQAIFMAACHKPIVVFDINDILKLNRPGSLVQLLINKIRDVEQLSGISKGPEIEMPQECDLPAHLSALL